MQHWIASSNIFSRLYLNSNPASMSFFEVKCGSLGPLIFFSSLEEHKLNYRYNQIKERSYICNKDVNMEKDSRIYSRVGIWNSEYLTERSSAISSIVIMNGEQLYLPFGLGCSRRNICALATSSTCTIWIQEAPNGFLSPTTSICLF